MNYDTMTATQKMQMAAPFILRIGLSLVFLWFGFQQLLHTANWLRMIPEWVTNASGLSAATLVHFNGAFEIVFGICLLLGFFTRVVSFLLALHMIHITLTLIIASGITAISMRDIGLSFAAVTLFLMGPAGHCSVDHWLCTRFEQKGIEN